MSKPVLFTRIYDAHPEIINEKVSCYLKENLINVEWVELVKFCWTYLQYLTKSTSEDDTYNEAERRLIINIFVISASCRVNAIKHVERVFISKEFVPEEFAGRGALDYFIGSVPITVLSENRDTITAAVAEESDPKK